MVNGTLYYQPGRNFAEKHETRGRHGITRGQAIITFILIGALFLLISGIFIPEVKADQTSYQTITVQEGDNLWEIAKTYNHSTDADLRDSVAEIMEVNQLSDEVIYPGQNLRIPVRTY